MTDDEKKDFEISMNNKIREILKEHEISTMDALHLLGIQIIRYFNHKKEPVKDITSFFSKCRNTDEEFNDKVFLCLLEQYALFSLSYIRSKIKDQAES